MIKSLKFSHKILLAAALVVIATFSLFTLYNDSLQRASIREDLEDYLHEMGEITASNVQNWLSGRILLIENLAQTLARDHSPETTQALLEQPLLGSTFLFTYLGRPTAPTPRVPPATCRPTTTRAAAPGTTPPPAPARPPSPNPTWSRPSTSWY
ncbi:Methyl-accepting chemotaxis protein PctB [Pseudomonas aeruginosa]